MIQKISIILLVCLVGIALATPHTKKSHKQKDDELATKLNFKVRKTHAPKSHNELSHAHHTGFPHHSGHHNHTGFPHHNHTGKARQHDHSGAPHHDHSAHPHHHSHTGEPHHSGKPNHKENHHSHTGKPQNFTRHHHHQHQQEGTTVQAN